MLTEWTRGYDATADRQLRQRLLRGPRPERRQHARRLWPTTASPRAATAPTPRCSTWCTPCVPGSSPVPAFDGSRIIGAILFEQTMDRQIEGVLDRAVPLGAEAGRPVPEGRQGPGRRGAGVQLMKPIPALDELLERANGHGIFGTKMRSVIKDADKGGISAIVDQQFEIGAPDLGGRPGADPRARGEHQEPAQGRGRGAAARRDLRATSTRCRPMRRSC